jgi:MSHA biogenesis protein MshP
MKKPVLTHREAGFALVNAIFLLVVLAFLGVVMVTLSGVQSRTPVFALQGARAYHAARSGIEWGIAKVPACNGSADNSGFTVAVPCTTIPASGIYVISSTATKGSYGSIDFVSRTVQSKVTGP